MQLQPHLVLIACSTQGFVKLIPKHRADRFSSALFRLSRTHWLCIFLLILSLPVASHATEPQSNGNLINVNLAPAGELAKKLPGIGPAKAQAIVQYREQHGPFKSVDSLVNVKGIGPAILAKIQALVVVGSSGDDNANQPLSKRGPTKTFAQQETAAQHAVRAALTLAARHAAHARSASQLK